MDEDVLEMHYNATQATTVPRLRNEDQAVAHMLTKTEVSRLFFSDLNVDVIQTAIIDTVKQITGKEISRQSDSELFLIMRSIYLQYARNDPNNFVPEVRSLNTRVVEYCIDVVVANLSQYLRYIQEVGRVPVPQERGAFISSAGSKTLELKSFY